MLDYIGICVYLEATKMFNSIKKVVSIVWWKKSCSYNSYIFSCVFGSTLPPTRLDYRAHCREHEILLPQALRVQGTIWHIQEWCFRPSWSACCSLGPFLKRQIPRGSSVIRRFFQRKSHPFRLFSKNSKASFFQKHRFVSSVTVLQECPKRSPMETCYRNTREAQPHSKMLSVRLDRYLICRIYLLVMQVKLMIDT